jgi:hypothetical protein
MSMLRVDALVVSRWRTGSLLGYNRREQQGPWLVRVIVRQLHRRLTIIKWSAVEGYVGHITLNRTARELDSHR